MPRSWRNPQAARSLALLGLLAAVSALAVFPTGIGLSTGATDELIDVDDFEAFGCTACHGASHVFPPVDPHNVRFTILDADGGFVNGPYTAEATYTISIRLNETVAPDSAGNRAGFNLRVTAGTLTGVEGQSQVTADGQATHVNARSNAWNVTWQAPATGPVSFRLFVNDVDGSGDPNPEDVVYQLFYGLTDPDGAALGAPVEEEEPHFGISLQQYWIGLIGLAGMLFIMVASFVYLKYVSPHHTDHQDR